MILDGHIHLHTGKCDQADLLRRLAAAGVEGGVLLSIPPASLLGDTPPLSAHERLENLFAWSEGQPNLFPFFWIDPLEDEALTQVEIAVDRGVAGFKVICDRYYHGDERAMSVFAAIARAGRPILFHSGILWDGKPSSRYNRPAEFETLLEIEGLKFALAHVAWPWCDELIAVYGKFLNAYTRRADLSVEMFIDLTPGTPPIYRQEVLTRLFTVGYDVEHAIFFGSDANANAYQAEWVQTWLRRDHEVLANLGLWAKQPSRRSLAGLCVAFSANPQLVLTDCRFRLHSEEVPMYFGEQTWTHIPEQTHKVVVLPLGSLEQHGRHLPILTDTLICTEIVRRAELLLSEEALFLPALWIGVSEHHRGFPGSLTASQATYVTLLNEILENLISDGFSRILLFNAHGGNITPVEFALYDVQMRHRDRRDLWLVLATWFVAAAPQIAALPQLNQKRVTHACELETSMILSLRPDLVHLEAIQRTDPESRAPDERFAAPPATQIAVATHPFDHFSHGGGAGYPEDATAEKGAALFSTAVQSLVECIRAMAGWEPAEPASSC